MSFIRFGEHGSTVYVYAGAVTGWGEVLICCGCFGDAGAYETAAEMIAHLRAHQAHGDVVPEHIFPGLAEWRHDITGPELIALEDRVHAAAGTQP